MFRRCIPAVLCILWLSSSPVRAAEATDSAAWWIAAAQTDAMQLGDASEKTGTLTALAFDFAAVDNIQAANQASDAALTAAADIKDLSARFNAMLAVASFHDQSTQPLAALQDMVQAHTTLLLIPAGPAADEATKQYDQFHSIINGFEQARGALDDITNAADRAQAFGALADAFARQGKAHQKDFAGAIAAAGAAINQISDPVQKDLLKSRLAQSQAAGGDADGADALARTVSDAAEQGQCYAAIADQYIKQAQDVVVRMTTDAGKASDDRSTALWLDVAGAREALNDKRAALESLSSAAAAADKLGAVDRADALSAIARSRVRLGDNANGAVAAADAAAAAQLVTDPADAVEAMMSVAAAQARCGLGAAALQSISSAQADGGRIPQDKRHPEGDPSLMQYLDVIQAAANAGDFATANTITAQVGDLRVRHDGALEIASAEVALGQYQAAEDTVHKEGSTDSEATVCGIIAASLARTRTPADADKWVQRLGTAADRVAARMAVAQVLEDKAAAAPAEK